jgi:hypothetical protein
LVFLPLETKISLRLKMLEGIYAYIKIERSYDSLSGSRKIHITNNLNVEGN